MKKNLLCFKKFLTMGSGSQFKFFRLHYVLLPLCKYNILYLFILMWCWTIFLTNRVMSWLLGSRPLNSVSEHHLSSVSCCRLSSVMYQLSAPTSMCINGLCFLSKSGVDVFIYEDQLFQIWLFAYCLLFSSSFSLPNF